MTDGSRVVPEGCLYPFSTKLNAAIIGRPEAMDRFMENCDSMTLVYNAVGRLQSRLHTGFFPLSTTPHSDFTVIAVPPAPLRSHILLVAGQPSPVMLAGMAESYMAACDKLRPLLGNEKTNNPSTRWVLIPPHHTLIGMP